jgi:hypothetical protein
MKVTVKSGMRIESGQVQFGCFAKIEYFVGWVGGFLQNMMEKISFDIGGSISSF